MKEKLLVVLAMTAAVALSVPGPVSAEKDAAQDTAPKADNTKVNKEQRANKEAADQQKESAADRKITQQIRRAVVKNKDLSTYAHNVKIITRGGMVTLKGPVRSEEEKQLVEQAAATVVGKEKITNQITIAPPKKGDTKKKDDSKKKGDSDKSSQ